MTRLRAWSAQRTRQAACSAFVVVVLIAFLGFGGQSTSVVAQVSDIPIIDAHGHLQARASVDELIRLMEQTGVSRMVLMPTHGPIGETGGTDEQALDYARRFPGRFVPFVGFQNRPPLAVDENWFAPNEAALRFLSSVDAKLRGGGFFGLGEIILRILH